MIQMQRLQPEMRKLQVQYKDDRQKLNEELMAFYKENNLNPLGGCLPLLLQTPIFIILYNVISGLTRIGPDGTFLPKYLHPSSQMFQDLNHTDEMMAFGIDLAISASTALSDGFVEGLPYVVMVAIVALSSYYQQKQIQGRNPNAEMPPQQKMLMRVFPAMFVVIAFVSPAALVVYFVTSNLYRIGMQHYITRTLYHGEDSLGAQAQRASAEAKKLKEQEGGPDWRPASGSAARPTAREAGVGERSPRTRRRRPAATAPTAATDHAAADVPDDTGPQPVQEEEEAQVAWSGSRRPARRSRKRRTPRSTSSAWTSRTPSSRWSRNRAPGCSAGRGARRGCGLGCDPPSHARRSNDGIVVDDPGALAAPGSGSARAAATGRRPAKATAATASATAVEDAPPLTMRRPRRLRASRRPAGKDPMGRGPAANGAGAAEDVGEAGVTPGHTMRTTSRRAGT